MSHFEGTDKLCFPLYNSTRKRCDGSAGNNILCHIVMRTAWAYKPVSQTQLNHVKNVFSPDCFSPILKKLRFLKFFSGIFRFPPASLACDQRTAPQRNESMIILAVRMEHISIASLSPPFQRVSWPAILSVEETPSIDLALTHHRWLTEGGSEKGSLCVSVCVFVCVTKRGTEKDVSLHSNPWNPTMSFKYQVHTMLRLMAM